MYEWALESSLQYCVWYTRMNGTRCKKKRSINRAHLYFMFALALLMSGAPFFCPWKFRKHLLFGQTQKRIRLLCTTAMAFQPLLFPFRVAAAEVCDAAGVLADSVCRHSSICSSLPKPGPLSFAPHLLCAFLPNDIHSCVLTDVWGKISCGVQIN